MIEKQTVDGIVTLRLAHGKASALDVELCDVIASELRAYRGATLAPEDAKSKGLIDEVVAADQLMQRAKDEAKRLAAIPPESFRLTKMQLRGIATAEADVKKVWADPDIHTHIRDYLAKT